MRRGGTRHSRLMDHNSLTTAHKSSPWFEKNNYKQLWSTVEIQATHQRDQQIPANKDPGNVGGNGAKQQLSVFTWGLPFDSLRWSSSRGSVKCEWSVLTGGTCRSLSKREFHLAVFQADFATWVSDPVWWSGGKLHTATQRTQRSLTMILEHFPPFGPHFCFCLQVSMLALMSRY